ncbi:bifunctional folylpolyglutamate synthase/dihydrofolate synthase [bacterium]|nr:bifunctional folylpolyglutamate synthase/dihydrofolate synthase [bacterium]
MTYENAIKKIHSLLSFGSRPGLDRIKKLLSLMGNPQDKLKFIHVAGTNGKGSVCQLLSSVLICEGYKTGLFISPYITDFRERIQINGEMISQSDLAEAVEKTFPLVEKLREQDCIITEFEYIMAVEFYIHSLKKCDVVVLETGMGGLLDCTNVIKPPLCSIITTVGIDHTAVLGGTLEKIAEQKCGIIKENSVAVTSKQDFKAMSVIEDTAKAKGVPLYKSEDVTVKIIKTTIEESVFEYKGEKLRLPLAGIHQIENAKTVLSAIDALNRGGILEISKGSIVKGFKSAKNPARLEVMGKSPLVILDGAHNPNGIKALADSLCTLVPHSDKICIMGMMSDKDSVSSIELLENTFTEVICVDVENPRSLKAEELAQECKGHFKNVKAVGSPVSAFDYAYEKAQKDGLCLVICGSLYLCSEIRPYILNKLNK